MDDAYLRKKQAEFEQKYGQLFIQVGDAVGGIIYEKDIIHLGMAIECLNAIINKARSLCLDHNEEVHCAQNNQN